MRTATSRTVLTAAALSAAAVLSACGGSENPATSAASSVSSSVSSGLGTSSGSSTSSAAPAGDLSGDVVIDGSSTVEPLSSAAAELFMGDNPDVNVTVGTSGTGGGFQKFCAGETDVQDASRSIEDDEAAICETNGIQFTELQVANDALTVVVNTENDWAECLTVEQLKKVWESGSTVKSWNEIDPSFPAEPLTLYGAGPDSGTFDYFTDAITGEEGNSRTDYNPTEDDNVTVQGVSGSKGGLGYFGFSYFEQNADKLKAVQIDSGAGCVSPSLETAQDGTYTPLSRPLFIYPSNRGLEKPQVQAFINYYLENSTSIAEAALFIPLTEEQLTEQRTALEELQSGGSASGSSVSATTS